MDSGCTRRARAYLLRPADASSVARGQRAREPGAASTPRDLRDAELPGVRVSPDAAWCGVLPSRARRRGRGAGRAHRSAAGRVDRLHERHGREAPGLGGGHEVGLVLDVAAGACPSRLTTACASPGTAPLIEPAAYRYGAWTSARLVASVPAEICEPAKRLRDRGRLVGDALRSLRVPTFHQDEGLDFV